MKEECHVYEASLTKDVVFRNESVYFLMKGFETSLLTMGMTVVHCEMKMNLSISNEEVKAQENFILPPDHIRN